MATSTQQRSRRNPICFLLIGVLVVAMGVLLAACAPQKSSEEVIRDGVAQEFDEMKEALSSAVSATAGLDQFGVSNAQFINAWLDGFTYTINNVKVDGNAATVNVTITCKSLSDALADWNEGLTDLVSDQATYQMSEADLNSKIGTLLMDSINAAPMETTTVDLPYELDGDTWKPGEGFEAALSNAFTGGSLKS